MSDSVPVVASEPTDLHTLTVPDSIGGKSGGITISTNAETKEQMEENFGGTVKAKDGEEVDPEKEAQERISKAASELGKKGAEAKRAKADKADDSTAAVERDAEAEAEGRSETDPKEKLGKPRDDPKARMLEATRKEAQAKRERDEAKKEKDELLAKFEELKKKVEATREPPKVEEPKPATGKPDPAKFRTTEEWVEAVAEWKAEERLKAYTAKQAEETRVKEYSRTIDEQLAKAVAARKEYEKTDPKFNEHVSDEVKQIANTPSFARDLHEPLKAKHVIADEIILAEKNGPLVMLHLSEHPEELERLEALKTPQEIQVEMRLLARSMNGAGQVELKPSVSTAKPPLKPLKGGPHVTEDEPDDNVSVEQHIRLMDKKVPWSQRRRR